MFTILFKVYKRSIFRATFKTDCEDSNCYIATTNFVYAISFIINYLYFDHSLYSDIYCDNKHNTYVCINDKPLHTPSFLQAYTVAIRVIKTRIGCWN